jgi:transcriptional antiterminator NusG
MRIEMDESEPTAADEDRDPETPVVRAPEEAAAPGDGAEDAERGTLDEGPVEAEDPVEVVAEQVSTEVEPGEEPQPEEPAVDLTEPADETPEPRAPAAEMPEPVEPEPGEPQPEPEPVEPQPAEPEPVEPVGEAVEPVEAVDEPEPTRDADPYRGDGDWYVVHTYSGYENKVKTNLESRIHTMQMEGKIFGVHIPMEDVMEIKSGKKQVVKKKQFPGYLLVRMVYDNDSWYVVRNTPGVTGFVSAGTGSKPTPLSKHEVEKILAVKKEEVRPQVRLGFEEGDVVRITSGPFADFNGTINEINPDQAKLKVLVNIFDRETPVELSFDQVSKV